MVETTKEERDRIRQMTHLLYEDAYEDENISGKAEEMDWMDIHVNQITAEKWNPDNPSSNKIAHWGRAGFNADHKRNLGIRFDDWRDLPVENEVTFLLHEVTHEWIQRNHSIQFYEREVENFERAMEKRSVEKVTGRLDWDIIRYQIVADAHNGTMSYPREQQVGAKELVDSIADELGLDGDVYRRLYTLQDTRGGEYRKLRELDYRRVSASEAERKTRDLLPEDKEKLSKWKDYLPYPKVRDGKVVENEWVLTVYLMTLNKYAAVETV